MEGRVQRLLHDLLSLRVDDDVEGHCVGVCPGDLGQFGTDGRLPCLLLAQHSIAPYLIIVCINHNSLVHQIPVGLVHGRIDTVRGHHRLYPALTLHDLAHCDS
jgi:hypothetical protein